MLLLGIETSAVHLQSPSLPCLAADMRKTVSKTLKTVLFHQNEHHRAKNGKVAFLIFCCGPFEGHKSYILRRAKKNYGDVPLITLSVVNCASAGTLPAEAQSLRPRQGRLNKLGKVAREGVTRQRFG